MSNALARRDDHQLPATATLPDLMRLGAVLASSGYFQDAKGEAQAVAKVLAGHELGIPPIAAMTGIHLVKGKVTLGANLIASQIRRSPRYDYDVRTLTDDACEIAFLDVRGAEAREIGTSTFTRKDAEAAKLIKADSAWIGHTRNMLFARAMSNGAKWFCPDVFAGPVYTPDELGAQVDYSTGEVIDVPPAATPGHRLHRLWELLTELGVEWTDVHRDAAVEALKKKGWNSQMLETEDARKQARAVLEHTFAAILGLDEEPLPEDDDQADEASGVAP